MAIEEPEAHLHPHLQRQVFSGFLRVRPHLARGENLLDALPTTVLLTTHSPHIASITPVRSFVLLREEVVSRENGRDARATVAASSAGLSLNKDEEIDLERYLEATRAEMLFARAVLLVEGEAELYLAPRLAELSGTLLDRLGISVCAINGTHFESYAVLLKALGIPFAIVTDGDPTRLRSGLVRARDLLKRMEVEVPPRTPDAGVRLRAAEQGVFIGDQTFELDLLSSAAADALLSTLADLATGTKGRERAQQWRASPKTVDAERLLADIESIGKGRFAQRLAATIGSGSTGGPAWVGPEYVRQAVEWVRERASIR